MQVTTKISVDMAKPNLSARVNAVQGDGNTRLAELFLLSGGAVWKPPDGVEASIAYCQPDGHRGLYDKLADGTDAISISGNVATLILAPQMLSVSGTVQATLVFNDAQLNRLTTFPFSISVARNPAVGAQKTEDYIRLQWLEDKLKELLGSGVFDCYTPIYGVDYGTPEEIAQIAQQAAQALASVVDQIREDIDGLKRDVASLKSQIKQYHNNGGESEPIAAALDYAILDFAVLS